MSRKQREKVKDAVAVSRIAVGAGAWVAPNLSGRLFGMDPEQTRCALDAEGHI